MKPKQEIVIQTGQVLTPMEMVHQAVMQGATVEVLEKLMALQERWEANEARKAFDSALAAAKAEIPVIAKNRTVDFTTLKGKTTYRHEDLAEIARTIDPVLAKHGLSYRHRTENQPDRVVVTCIIFGHGHQQENSLGAPLDLSGNKNAIQAIGSTTTYLQRYTLKAALGLAAADDDDGKTADKSPITEAQADELTKLIAEKKADVTRFLKWAGAESISDVPAAKFADAVAMLNAKVAS